METETTKSPGGMMPNFETKLVGVLPERGRGKM